ncbi:receptor-like protein 43 [Ziziphus jujuba]|uniref:Receptor-like protein 43 n=1 Tax=Ziziphus jujuba TaxID=326968 RepID=A0ABM4A067_ZIZJJ|nr:receptor-like protein 43 [Ziziphus jujuba]
MESFLFSYFIFVQMLLSLSLVFPQHAFSFVQTRCHDHEKSALWQFEQIFIIDMSASHDPSSYPTLSSWNYNNDCCSWDGVDCNEDTGRVIGLDLSSSCLFGSINSNSTLFHLVHLQSLNLADNNFNYSTIPTRLAHLSHLTYLNLSRSRFFGQVPTEISQLSKLSSLDLSYNIDSVDKRLLRLEGFSFKSLIHNLTSLEKLILSTVDIASTVPERLANLSSLTTMNLESCSLLGEFLTKVFYLPLLQDLNVNFNDDLSGYLPEFDLRNSLKYLKVSSTSFSGEISPSICNLSSLHILALSSSNLGGKLPPCLGNFSSMSMLKLYGNNFCGSIPDTWTNNCRMRVMDLSENQFQGHFPRSLANCTLLELLDIKKNQIEDSFPFWLETLPELFALFMSSNRFHGAIGEPQSKVSFPKLQIIDLSHNNFSGHLPWGYFQQWNAMKVFDNTHELTYLNGSYCGKNWTLSFFYSMKVTNKGIVLDYGKIPDFLKMMDLSNNRFEGDIPELIGNLKGLSSLNISNNILTGPIPSSLGNLSYLEVLDLSHNKLSGEIPLQLTQLNFLGSFSVANNNLTGAIPQGKQFDTFPNSSFEGNMGLFGSPLSNKYGNSEENSPPDPSPTVQEEEEESVLELDWKAVVIGCGCGIVIGIVVGHFVIEYKHDWFVETYGIWKRKQG